MFASACVYMRAYLLINERSTTWCAIALTSINKFDIELTAYGAEELAMKHSQLTLSLVNSDVVFHLEFTIKISRGKNHLDLILPYRLKKTRLKVSQKMYLRVRVFASD